MAGGAWLGPPLTLLGNRARPGSSRPCPTPIWFILEIFIKNILHSHIFPGHSSSIMTLAVRTLKLARQWIKNKIIFIDFRYGI